MTAPDPALFRTEAAWSLREVAAARDTAKRYRSPWG